MTEGFHAGVGRATITPSLTVPHAGWGAQTHLFADGVETDLWATALVLTDGREMAAVVDLDLVVVTPDDAQAVRKEVARVLAPGGRVAIAVYAWIAPRGGSPFDEYLRDALAEAGLVDIKIWREWVRVGPALLARAVKRSLI